MPEARAEIWSMESGNKLAVYSGVGPAMKFLVDNPMLQKGAAIMWHSADGEWTEFSGDTLDGMLKEYGEQVAKARS